VCSWEDFAVVDSSVLPMALVSIHSR
jgi:hypothetical protein